jgi:hypothetical protein
MAHQKIKHNPQNEKKQIKINAARESIYISKKIDRERQTRLTL